MENPLRYQKFSERVLEVIRRFEAGQLAAAEALKEFESIAKDLQDEDRAHESSGLNERAYGVLKILESLALDGAPPAAAGRVAEREASYGADSSDDSSDDRSDDGSNARLVKLAERIDHIYASDASAPVGWHLKDQQRKMLRQKVRHTAHDAGVRDLMDVSNRVEEYALRHYVKVG